VSALAVALNVRLEARRQTFEDILCTAGAAGTSAVLLRGDPAREDAPWRQARQILERWARMQRSPTHEVPRFCAVLVAPPRDAVPEEEANLKVLWAHRWESALDVRILSRLVDDGVDPLRSTYRDYVLTSVAGPDIALAAELSPIVGEADNTIGDACARYGAGRGWTKADILKALQALNGFRGPGGLVAARLPVHLERLWLSGQVQWSAEYGAELHPAAQALIGRTYQIERRIWRGQAALALPLLNHLRAAVCDYLTATHGTGWTDWATPEEGFEARMVRESPSSCQLGHLCRALEGRRPRGEPLIRRLHLLALALRDLRNELAHYRPVPYRQLVELRRLAMESGAWADDLGC
jgi:hypothetical protein